MTYLDEVVRFIEKNTAGVNIGPANTQAVDPYTGASRYQAGQSSSTSGASDYMDPFTGKLGTTPCVQNRLLLTRGECAGASRYRSPSATPAAAAPAAGLSDPFTGASRYSGAAPPQAPAKSKVLPVASICQPCLRSAVSDKSNTAQDPVVPRRQRHCDALQVASIRRKSAE